MGCGQSSSVTEISIKQSDICSTPSSVQLNSTTQKPEEQSIVPVPAVQCIPVDGNTQYNSSYSIKEISAHNSVKGFIDLFPWKSNVHSAESFKQSVKRDVEEYQDAILNGDIYKFDFKKIIFEESWCVHPVFFVMSTGFRYAKMAHVIMQSKVGTIKRLSDTEYFSDIFHDAKEIEKSLLQNETISQYEGEYLELLGRFFKLYSDLSGSIPRNFPVPSGDPNEACYRFPNSVDPSSIRVWISDWETFDMEIKYDNDWNCPWGMPLESEPVIIEVLTPEQIYRHELSDLEPFQHDVEGEAAWDVMPLDIVKNDLTTLEQEEVIESRSKRTDLDDVERMHRRREALAQYFITERADGLATYCDKYVVFAGSLEEGWKKFLTLCE